MDCFLKQAQDMKVLLEDSNKEVEELRKKFLEFHSDCSSRINIYTSYDQKRIMEVNYFLIWRPWQN